MYNYKTAAGFLLTCFLLIGVGQGTDSESVAEYYWEKAGEAGRRYNPNVPGVAYRLTTKSYRHAIGGEGQIRRTDSALQTFYFDAGRLDSVVTERGDADRFEELDLAMPEIFDLDFEPTLFPNDTGGPRLALGLWSDSVLAEQPDGLLVIDRYDYFARALYLYYPAEPGYKRYTRSLQYRLVDSLLFPDTVWTVATKYGIFFTESFRLETAINDIEILRNDRASTQQ